MNDVRKKAERTFKELRLSFSMLRRGMQTVECSVFGDSKKGTAGAKCLWRSGTESSDVSNLSYASPVMPDQGAWLSCQEKPMPKDGAKGHLSNTLPKFKTLGRWSFQVEFWAGLSLESLKCYYLPVWQGSCWQWLILPEVHTTSRALTEPIAHNYYS